VQNADVLPIRPFSSTRHETVIRLAEGGRRDQVVSRARGGKGTGLADERGDDMMGVNPRRMCCLTRDLKNPGGPHRALQVF
jgi:hypothetical protein